MTTCDVAYLVCAYHKPGQLLRLIRALRTGSPRAAIFLHWDAKAGTPPGPELAALDMALIEPRVPVYWGDGSLVRAMLHSLSHARNQVDFRYIAFLSGQDYPLRPLAAIERDTLASGVHAFMEADRGHEYSHPYLYRYWRLPRFPYAYRVPAPIWRAIDGLRRGLNRLQPFLRIEWSPRKQPSRLGIRWPAPFGPRFPCHFGSDWFTLSRRAADYLLSFAAQRPDVTKHYTRTLIPSESFFATVLASAEGLNVVLDDNRRFILWTSNHAAHPTTLTMAHFEAMVTSGKDVGRKFEMDQDSAVPDALDRHLSFTSLAA